MGQWVAVAFFLCSPFIAYAEQAESRPRTFETGNNWVVRHLNEGGSIDAVTGLSLPKGWKDTAEWDDLAPRRDLPKIFDWRWQAGGLQPIRNQKNCGSCWAFSVIATLEGLIKIHTGKVVDLAEQTLVSTCSNAGSCSGGYFRAFDYLRSPGIPDEQQDPYRAVNTSCRQGLRPEEKITSWRYVGSRNRAPTIEQIKTALFEKGPVSVTIHANSTLSAYDSGVFNSCSSGSTNHMVNLEGWNDNGGYWILRNSWGENWGESGYMRIKYTSASGYKCNRVGEHTAYAIYNDTPVDVVR